MINSSLTAYHCMDVDCWALPRRTLLDGSAAAGPAQGHAAADASGAAAWPTAWVLLRPVRAGPGAAGAIYGPNEARLQPRPQCFNMCT